MLKRLLANPGENVIFRGNRKHLKKFLLSMSQEFFFSVNDQGQIKDGSQTKVSTLASFQISTM